MRLQSRARRQAVLALFLTMELAAMTVSSQGLFPRHVAGDIRVSAPAVHFLTGKSLSRLHDGAAVPFDFQLTIEAESQVVNDWINQGMRAARVI